MALRLIPFPDPDIVVPGILLNLRSIDYKELEAFGFTDPDVNPGVWAFVNWLTNGDDDWWALVDGDDIAHPYAVGGFSRGQDNNVNLWMLCSKQFKKEHLYSVRVLLDSFVAEHPTDELRVEVWEKNRLSRKWLESIGFKEQDSIMNHRSSERFLIYVFIRPTGVREARANREAPLSESVEETS